MPAKSVSKSKLNEQVAPLSTSLDFNIDYPREEELILPGHYAIRISAPDEAQVEVSINNGEWLGCRTALGYYWFDWEPKSSGEVTIVARCKVGKGRSKKSSERFCRIVGSKKN